MSASRHRFSHPSRAPCWQGRYLKGRVKAPHVRAPSGPSHYGQHCLSDSREKLAIGKTAADMLKVMEGYSFVRPTDNDYNAPI